jgi:ABC-type phosphate/phosphonate transport system permease subunit
VFPATLELATLGVLIGVILGVPLGVLAAVKRDPGSTRSPGSSRWSAIRCRSSGWG